MTSERDYEDFVSNVKFIGSVNQLVKRANPSKEKRTRVREKAAKDLRALLYGFGTENGLIDEADFPNAESLSDDDVNNYLASTSEIADTQTANALQEKGFTHFTRHAPAGGLVDLVKDKDFVESLKSTDNDWFKLYAAGLEAAKDLQDAEGNKLDDKKKERYVKEYALKKTDEAMGRVSDKIKGDKYLSGLTKKAIFASYAGLATRSNAKIVEHLQEIGTQIGERSMQYQSRDGKDIATVFGKALQHLAGKDFEKARGLFMGATQYEAE